MHSGSFHDMVKRGEDIWLTNQAEGTVLLELQRVSQGSKPFVIKIPPIKKYPFKLNAFVPYPIIQHDSPTIFDWIQRDVFVLEDPDWAEEIYDNDPDLERTISETIKQANKKKNFKVDDPGLSVASGSGELAAEFTGKARGFMGDDVGEEFDDEEADSKSFKLAAKLQRVPPQIGEMVASLHEDPTLKDEMLVKLKSFKVLDEDMLSEAALGFVLDNCGKYPQIAKFAKAELAKFQDAKPKKKAKKTAKKKAKKKKSRKNDDD